MKKQMFASVCVMTLFFTMSFFTFSCKKDGDEPEACDEECNIIQGRILTGDGTEPVKGVVLEVKYFSLFVDGRVLARSVTDENGNYELRFHLWRPEPQPGVFSVNVEIKPPQGYYFEDVLGSGIDVPFVVDSVTEQDYYLPRLAYASLPVKVTDFIPDHPDVEAHIWIRYKGVFGTNYFNLRSPDFGFGSSLRTRTDATFLVKIPAEIPISIEYRLLESDKRRSTQLKRLLIREIDTVVMRGDTVHLSF